MNWLAIIIAAVANMVIGFLWYGTWAFGKSWIQLSGRNMGEGMQAGPLYGLTAVAAGTQSLLRVEVSGFVARLLWPLIRPSIRRALKKENAGLKARGELGP